MTLFKFASALLLLFITYFKALSQNPYNLKDGRQEGSYCTQCIEAIKEKPKEALFGIDIHKNGDVYFSMSDLYWFEKIFSSANGITADIISKDRYGCGENRDKGGGLFKGYVLPPLYKANFKANTRSLAANHIMIKIGKLPANLIGKELEGNLVILNGNFVCYYSNFINIDRSVWELLPMGLYTDKLLNTSTSFQEGNNEFFTYSKKVQNVINFPKNKVSYNEADITRLYDSLDFKNYTIKKIEIRAYSSVEGPLNVNTQLMLGRASSMVKVLKKNDPSLQRTTILTAENWVDFLEDIKATKYAFFSKLSKVEIKRKLTDLNVLAELEPVLSKHRKAIVTVYLESKSSAFGISNANIRGAFDAAIVEKKIDQARILLKEIVDRIIDNKLPENYLNQLEIPMEKQYLSVLSDREVYKYYTMQTSAQEALDIYRELKKFDSENGQINYNICALTLFGWQSFEDSIDIKQLLSDIQGLRKQRIDESLVKRMLINYHILLSANFLTVGNYEAKDEAIMFIRDLYTDLVLSDEEIYSLSKFFAYYSQFGWAEELVYPRVSRLDVNTDLLFYFINLGFYHPAQYDSELFNAAMLNAINLDSKRFCNFFKPNDSGGASMQLLEYTSFKQLYCENCNQQ